MREEAGSEDGIEKVRRRRGEKKRALIQGRMEGEGGSVGGVVRGKRNGGKAGVTHVGNMGG